MKTTLRATWASRINTYRARVNKDCGDATHERLLRIRDNWARDVRVDTGHFRDTVAATEPTMQDATHGYIQPPHEDYFVYNEYGTRRMAARPSMRQAIAAESNDFGNKIVSILQNIL